MLCVLQPHLQQDRSTRSCALSAKPNLFATCHGPRSAFSSCTHFAIAALPAGRALHRTGGAHRARPECSLPGQRGDRGHGAPPHPAGRLARRRGAHQRDNVRVPGVPLHRACGAGLPLAHAAGMFCCGRRTPGLDQLKNDITRQVGSVRRGAGAGRATAQSWQWGGAPPAHCCCRCAGWHCTSQSMGSAAAAGLFSPY